MSIVGIVKLLFSCEIILLGNSTLFEFSNKLFCCPSVSGILNILLESLIKIFDGSIILFCCPTILFSGLIAYSKGPNKLFIFCIELFC